MADHVHHVHNTVLHNRTRS